MTRSTAPCRRCGQYYYEGLIYPYCPACLNKMRYDSQKSGGGGGVGGQVKDWIAMKFAIPFLIIIAIVYFIKTYWMYVLCAGIAGACIFICIMIAKKAAKPGLKILITSLVGIALIVIILVTASPTNASSNKQQPRSQSSSIQAPQERFMFVNSDALNVRSGPSSNHDLVGRLTRDTRVQIIDDSSGQWWKIRYGNIEGYVNAQYLSGKK